MADLIRLIVEKLLEWGIPFTLGLLFRKKVARFLIITKMYLFNDVITINLFSTRYYTPCGVSEITHKVYREISTKIPSVKLLNLFSNGIRISVPVFGNIRVFIEKTYTKEMEPIEEAELNEKETIEAIRVTISPETPIRLGVREIPRLNEFAQYVEIIFGILEKHCLEKSEILQSYTVIESSRIKRFVEEKRYKFEDDELGTYVHVTPNKVTLTVKASTQIGKAAQKYLLI